jgi:hypothetical protein
MPHKIVSVMAVIVGLFVLGARSAPAAPMLCSGEQKTCNSDCQKSPRALIAECVATCRNRLDYCKHTGCWNNGRSRYCGLMRK